MMRGQLLTLIQSGGGTGPTKPRQPPKHWEGAKSGRAFLEDESLPAMPYLIICKRFEFAPSRGIRAQGVFWFVP